MADVFDTSIPLPVRLGTQLFELRSSDDDVFADDVEDKTVAPVGHVLYDATTRALCVGTEKVAEKELMWNDLSNTVTWSCAGANLCEGRLCFTDDLREAIGTVTCCNGECVLVTASPMLPGPGEGPPAYGSTLMTSAFASNAGPLAMGMGAASPFMMFNAIGGGAASEKDKDTQKIYMTEFKTERRLKTEDGADEDDDDDWAPWYSLEWGMEMHSPGTPVVCFVNDVDVSAETTLDHSTPGQTTLVKMEGDADSKKEDYTFTITLNSEVEEDKQAFAGTLIHKNKAYAWRGTWRASKDRARTVARGPTRGPGDRTVTQLMAVTSLKSTTKDVEVEVEGADGKTTRETRTVTEDMAQEEADRIFARIILNSAPADVMKMLSPDMETLDADETRIAALGPDYLARAALVNVFSFLKNTPGVSQAQKDRINEDKCKAFVRACAQTAEVKQGARDYVAMWGWGEPEKTKIQRQYREVAQACYRLGYRRAVKEFEVYLTHAKEWYGIFAKHLVGDLHIRELTGRVKAGDSKIAHDVYDWNIKLQILEDEAGTLEEGDPTIPEIIAQLHGVAPFAVLDGIPWSGEHESNIIKFFEELDGMQNDATKTYITKTKEYVELQRLLKERDQLTTSELAKLLVEGLNDHAKQLKRAPSLAELSSAVTRNEQRGFWPAAWARGRAVFRWAARAAVVFAGIFFLQKTLGEGAGTLSLPEQVSIWASLADASRQVKTLVGKPLSKLAQSEAAAKMSRGLGKAIGKLVPGRAAAWMEAAKAWGAKVVAKIGSKVPNFIGKAATAVKGFFTRNWANIAKGIGLAFGFFVSMATLVASAFEFKKALEEGRPMDKIFSGVQVVIAALGIVAFSVQIVASLAGAAQIAAIAGTLGIWLAGIGIIVAVVALIVTLTQPREDPIKKILDKYGDTYGLLK
ncbi:hypothetical protein PsYK624_053590 [Phanerochaete sordida]|uniref:Uncharacterized protein n=1 Tax=Phanerochaete sordida TaxID=48140 RepID=A0A9P3LCV7_9APHY|nr:hypothetical protein PsYK624_053590 [Phanerochaete sordida]